MNFCTQCGSPVTFRIPEHDDRQRHVCDACGHIHYLNPRIVVCSIPTWEGRVLLCKRSIEPRYGLWTLPGGFMENNESTQAAAERETLEEACARIEIHDLYSMFNVIHINQVHLFFRATLRSPDFAPGAESLEAALFTRDEVPWDRIAFPAVGATLKQYFKDLDRGVFPLRLADIVLGEDNTRLIMPHNFSHD